MTKEEILDEIVDKRKSANDLTGEDLYVKSEVLKSMQQYAEQMTSELAESLVKQQLQLKEKDKEIHYLQLQVKDLQEQINKR